MNAHIRSRLLMTLLFCVAACGGGANSVMNGNTQAGSSSVPSAGTAAGTPVQMPAAGGSGAAVQAGQSGTISSPGSAGNAAPATAGSHAGVAASGSGGMAAAGVGGASAPVAGGAAGNVAAGGTGAPATGDCDRACLIGMMQMYLDAVVAHDPTKVPISSTVKMTDNGVAAKPGDGLWKTATALDKDKRLDFADPVMKNVGTHVVVSEGSSPVMYLVRLKVEGMQLTEIETMTVRRANAANSFFTPDNLKPQPVFLQMPDPGKRMTRDQLMMLQEEYLDYLEGKKTGSQIPFDAKCARYENGVQTASGAAFTTQSWSFQVTRRILVIDEEAGITFGMFPFMQSASPLVVGEAFKMMDNKIMMIQAIMSYMPVGDWK
jgi:hypothetical protein